MSPAGLRVPLSALRGFDPVGLYGYGPDGLGLGLIAVSTGVHVVCDGPDLHEPEEVDIDLTHAATRDRVARYIAERVGLEVGSTAPGWQGAVDGWRVLGREPHSGDVRLFTAGAAKWARTTRLPALVDLDPTDDTRLPDGSRFVDAVALARVAVRVGGAR